MISFVLSFLLEISATNAHFFSGEFKNKR